MFAVLQSALRMNVEDRTLRCPVSPDIRGRMQEPGKRHAEVPLVGRHAHIPSHLQPCIRIARAEGDH